MTRVIQNRSRTVSRKQKQKLKRSKPKRAAAAPASALRLESKRDSFGVARPMAISTEHTPLPRHARVHYVQVPGAHAELMLPATGKTPQESYQRWAAALVRADIFGDQRKEVAELLHLKPSAGESAVDDRPRIGIMVHEAMHLAHEKEDLQTLVREVEKMGCRAVLIPPMSDLVLPDDPLARQQAVGSMLHQLDGVIGPGGRDLHPRLYGEKFEGSVETNYPRDRYEFNLLKQALDEELFILGICRSHQLLNVVGGATMVQEMQREHLVRYSHEQRKLGFELSAPLILETKDGVREHRVQVSGDLEAVLGEKSLVTNSLHHQAVDGAAPGFEVVGSLVDPDTGNEVIEATRGWKFLTLQFHPEYRPDEPESQALLGVLKRSWAFYFADQIRHEGGKPTAEGILKRIEGAKVELSAADLTWLKTELAAHLGG